MPRRGAPMSRLLIPATSRWMRIAAVSRHSGKSRKYSRVHASKELNVYSSISGSVGPTPEVPPGPGGVAKMTSGASPSRELNKTCATPGSGMPPYCSCAKGHHTTAASQPGQVSGTDPTLNSTPVIPTNAARHPSTLAFEVDAITYFTGTRFLYSYPSQSAAFPTSKAHRLREQPRHRRHPTCEACGQRQGCPPY